VNRNWIIAMAQRRRTVLIATFAVALIALPFILTFLKPTYVAVAHVMMVGKDSMIPSSDMGTLTVSQSVIDRINERFSLGGPDLLRSRIDAKPGLRSNVMPIRYRDKNPKRARDAVDRHETPASRTARHLRRFR
jgi:capsular polysaccharide biosynthesis protein